MKFHILLLKKRISFVLFLVMLSSFAMAQPLITGKILDQEGQPISGATVNVKGKSLTTMSGVDGTFSISASTKDILVISFIGYQTIEIPIKNLSNTPVV